MKFRATRQSRQSGQSGRTTALIVAALASALLAPVVGAPAHADAPTLLINIDPGNLASYNPADSTTNVINIADNQIGVKDDSIVYHSDFGGYFSFPGNGGINFDSKNFGNTFTVEAWVRPKNMTQDLGEGNINTIIANTYANLNSPGFKVEYNNWMSEDRSILIEAGNGGAYGDPASGNVTQTAGNQVTTGDWQLLSYTFDNATHSISLYRNGNRLCSTGVPVNDIVTDGAWVIGSMIYGSYAMYGDLGQLKMYNQVLSDADINANFNAMRDRYGVAATTVTQAPLSIHAPVITGTTNVGDTLTTDHGSWNNCVDSYAGQWARSATETGTYTDLVDQTSLTYSVTADDINQWLRYTSSAHNEFGDASAAGYFYVGSSVPALDPPAFYLPFGLETAVRHNEFTGGSPVSTGGAIESWSISPDLPDGFSLNSSGQIVGTPTTVLPPTTFTLTAHNAAGDVSQPLYLSVLTDVVAPTITFSPSNAIALQVGTYFPTNAVLRTSGDTPTVYNISPELPAGLTFDTSTGRISGYPTDSIAETTYTITASNEGGDGSTTFVLYVAPAPVTRLVFAPVWNVSSNQSLLKDQSFSTILTATNATSYLLRGNLPTGLSFNNRTGALTGTPTTAGDYSFAIDAVNGPYVVSQVFHFTVIAPANIPTPNVEMTARPDVVAPNQLPDAITVRANEIPQTVTLIIGPNGESISVDMGSFKLSVANTNLPSPALIIPAKPSAENPIVGLPGLQVTASAHVDNALPNTPASLVVASSPTVIAQGKLDAKGDVVFTGLLPSNLEVGNHSLQIVTFDNKGTLISFTIPFVVKPEIPTTVGPTSAGSETTAPTPASTGSTTPLTNKKKIISFAFAKSTVTSADKAIVKSLIINNSSQVTIYGYAQASAGEDDLRISLDRAIEVRKAILALHPGANVTVYGLGTKKNATCVSVKNRCAVVVIKK